MGLYIRVGDPNVPKKDRHIDGNLDSDYCSQYIEVTNENIGEMLYRYIDSPSINSDNSISVEYLKN